MTDQRDSTPPSSTATRAPCPGGCGIHFDGPTRPNGMAACCDPNDCGPCCEHCPTCPTVGRWAAEAVQPESTSVQCGNTAHPDGAWHPATPLPYSWDWRARFRQRRNRRRHGCPCGVQS